LGRSRGWTPGSTGCCAFAQCPAPARAATDSAPRSRWASWPGCSRSARRPSSSRERGSEVRAPDGPFTRPAIGKDPVRSLLRIGFEHLERGADRVFGPGLNPMAQLGAIGFFLFWIVAISGVYLFIFFDTGVEIGRASCRERGED